MEEVKGEKLIKNQVAEYKNNVHWPPGARLANGTLYKISWISYFHK